MENQKNDLHSGQYTVDITAIIDDMWRGFKRFWFLLILLVAVSTGIGVGYVRVSYTPYYEAYTTFVVTAETHYRGNISYFDGPTSASMANSFTYVLNSGALKDVVARELDMEYLPVSITASAMEDTNLLTINVSGKDPQLCYDVLNAVIENYPTLSEYIIGETKLTVMDESGLPTTPINSANYKAGGKTGAMVGIAVCLAILIGYALTRQTVRREDDLKRYTSITHLGSVPQIRVKKRSGRARILIDEQEDGSLFSESLRGIRNRIIHRCEKDGKKVIIVTSANAGEGKTTMAVNLAITLAKKKKRVILVDGDLRNPSVGPSMNLDGEGITTIDLLKGEKLTRDTVRLYKKLPLLVVPGKKPDKNSQRALKEGPIRGMIENLSRQADYIIIDTPPCGMMSDAAVFARCADGVVFVVRQEYTRIDRILQAIELISETGKPILGYMINGAKTGITGYGYGGYGYGYGGYGYGRKYGYGKKYGYGYGYGYGEQTEENLFPNAHKHTDSSDGQKTAAESESAE